MECLSCPMLRTSGTGLFSPSVRIKNRPFLRGSKLMDSGLQKNGAGVIAQSVARASAAKPTSPDQPAAGKCPFNFGSSTSGTGAVSTSAVAQGTYYTLSEDYKDKPVKPLPGEWGGPLQRWWDKYDFFTGQGWYEYIRSRKEKFGTVFRANMPRFNLESRVILILDQKAYPVLYDMNKVEKKDLFFGEYEPEPGYTFGQRVCAYADPSEEIHRKAKSYSLGLLQTYGANVLTPMIETSTVLFDQWEAAIKSHGQAEVFDSFYEYVWNWLLRTFGFKTVIDGDGHVAKDWVGPQLLPLISLGVPGPLELLIKLFPPLPSFAVKKGLDKLGAYFDEHGKEPINLGVSQYGLTYEEAKANLYYFLCFNAHGAIASVLASTLTAVYQAGPYLLQELHDEAVAAVEKYGDNGVLTFEALENMPLGESTVYEVLRLVPPISPQHARAKEDMLIESWDALYEVKKGDLLLGFCYFASHDPKVFQDPDDFKPRRFFGPEGQALLKNVLWSNGPQDATCTAADKQCPGKDYVALSARVFLAMFALRYKGLELTGKIGWNLTKVVPGPGMADYSVGKQSLHVKNLVRL